MAVGALRVYAVAALDGAIESLAPGTSLVPFRDIGAIVREAPYVRSSGELDLPDYRRVI